MPQDPPDAGLRVGRALHLELREAGDQKIKRITAMLDGVADPRANQAVLDPLRARLASLKPARPLRCSRLLFIPLDPLLVAPLDWQPSQPSIPRSVLTSIYKTVRAGLRNDAAAAIDAMIAGHQTDAVQTITDAGILLWPLAAEILAAAPPPVEWSNTGLKSAHFPPLAKAIAAVLRRASALRELLLIGDTGPLPPDDRLINEILTNIGDEPDNGCAMIARLVLMQSPHLTALWQQRVAAIENRRTRTVLQEAMVRGMDEMITILESGVGLTNEIDHAPVAAVAAHVRRVNRLLQQIEGDTETPRHRDRIRAIRATINKLCLARFAIELSKDLLAPLVVASGPVDPAGQTMFETATRDLRKLETAARKVGGSASYDKLLGAASDAVIVAAEAGILSPIRKLRLIELLAGPAAAAALYQQR